MHFKASCLWLSHPSYIYPTLRHTSNCCIPVSSTTHLHLSLHGSSGVIIMYLPLSTIPVKHNAAVYTGVICEWMDLFHWQQIVTSDHTGSQTLGTNGRMCLGSLFLVNSGTACKWINSNQKKMWQKYFSSMCHEVTAALLCSVLVLPQKIFVMPNMDDVWLPIMHSAMDTRSNANLVTVTNDALKDPEPEESDVSDMWILQVHNNGHLITMAIWKKNPHPQPRHIWVHQ